MNGCDTGHRATYGARVAWRRGEGEPRVNDRGTHRLVVHAEHRQQHRRQQSGSVLAERAVEHDRVRLSHRDDPQRVGDRRRALGQHLDVALDEEVDDTGLAGWRDASVLPRLAEHRQVVVRRARAWQLGSTRRGLRRGAEVDHGADPEIGERREVARAGAREVVGAVHTVPAEGLAGATLVAAQVTHVEERLERDVPRQAWCIDGHGFPLRFGPSSGTGETLIGSIDAVARWSAASPSFNQTLGRRDPHATPDLPTRCQQSSRDVSPGGATPRRCDHRAPSA